MLLELEKRSVSCALLLRHPHRHTTPRLVTTRIGNEPGKAHTYVFIITGQERRVPDIRSTIRDVASWVVADSDVGPTVGECCMRNKIFPTLTKIDLGDEHLQEERLDPHTLVDR